MGVNKVDLANGETLIDLQNDTVTPETLAKGATAHNKKGERIVGTMVAGEGGSSGSGIIDVTELPTSGIDENAVYRLTENIQTEKTEIYIRNGSTVITIRQYLASLGVPTVPNIYVVDELPSDMKVTDVQTFSQFHFYILKSDGVAYANVPAYGGVITVGLFGFKAMGYDKGFTENINNETENGVYTTIEAYKQVVRWFIRKNGEWQEITAYINIITPHGFDYLNIVSGDLTTRMFGAVDIISSKCSEIDENWFLMRNGEYYKVIHQYLFLANPFVTVTIPQFIERIYDSAFVSCTDLTAVTFKGKVTSMSPKAFDYCINLTTINVPWSEGEVANAPWGATNATINYNYTGE